MGIRAESTSNPPRVPTGTATRRGGGGDGSRPAALSKACLHFSRKHAPYKLRKIQRQKNTLSTLSRPGNPPSEGALRDTGPLKHGSSVSRLVRRVPWVRLRAFVLDFFRNDLFTSPAPLSAPSSALQVARFPTVAFPQPCPHPGPRTSSACTRTGPCVQPAAWVQGRVSPQPRSPGEQCPLRSWVSSPTPEACLVLGGHPPSTPDACTNGRRARVLLFSLSFCFSLIRGSFLPTGDPAVLAWPAPGAEGPWLRPGPKAALRLWQVKKAWLHFRSALCRPGARLPQPPTAGPPQQDGAPGTTAPSVHCCGPGTTAPSMQRATAGGGGGVPCAPPRRAPAPCAATAPLLGGAPGRRARWLWGRGAWLAGWPRCRSVSCGGSGQRYACQGLVRSRESKARTAKRGSVSPVASGSARVLGPHIRPPGLC